METQVAHHRIGNKSFTTGERSPEEIDMFYRLNQKFLKQKWIVEDGRKEVNPTIFCKTCQTETVHDFVKRRRDRTSKRFQWLVYKCAICKTERKWGRERKEKGASVK